ncbi:hypothetical protein [Stenoxybacter acetivorans]|uniref:hypothetical protein n=1 Tax=Stenoxybacter acetivorans TaxID=422441 RepID=UPI0005639F31|nr:hypothetical protein [Stenoxybacter acetivorans]
MKQLINVWFIGLLFFNLTGCMDTVTRFWNNDGWRPFPAKAKAYDECSAEALKAYPLPPKTIGDFRDSKGYDGWSNAFGQKESECMKRKGY